MVAAGMHHLYFAGIFWSVNRLASAYFKVLFLMFKLET